MMVILKKQAAAAATREYTKRLETGGRPAGQLRATGYVTSKFRRDEVESTHGLSFGVSKPVPEIESLRATLNPWPAT